MAFWQHDVFLQWLSRWSLLGTNFISISVMNSFTATERWTERNLDSWSSPTVHRGRY